MIYMVFDERNYLRIVTSEWDAAYCMIGYLVRRKHRPHMVLVLSLGLSVSPALAADNPVTSTGSFWQALAESSPDIVGDIIGGIPLIGEDVCSVSEDRRHHGKVIKRPADWAYPPTEWVALCDYCGDSFKE